MQGYTLTDKCKMLLGLEPYNTPDNIVRGDGRFAHDLIKEYGPSKYYAEMERLQNAFTNA